MDDTTRTAPTVAAIRRLTIERFRGVEKLIWLPAPGVNVILGGGNVGKSTLLDAIGLLLNPSNTSVLSDADYWRRDPSAEFFIEAVLVLPQDCGISEQRKIAWPWEWDGEKLYRPAPDDPPQSEPSAREAAYCVRVRGTSDMDLSYEVCQPDGSFDHFSVTVRRRIGLVKLGGDDRNERDLRLLHGSALDRLLADKTLRGRLSQRLSDEKIEEALTSEAQNRLTELDTAFKREALPDKLGLGLVGGPGASLNALVGLTATKSGVRLPLGSWGSGTRRLAALEISSTHHGENPITVVDEVERGLEPYRQRKLIAQLLAGKAQVFLTTHSSAALSAATAAQLWYLDGKGQIGKLSADVRPHQKRDPETFLARLSIVAEGITEYGFVRRLLGRTVTPDLLGHGIWITDAMGHDSALMLLHALSGSGLRFAGFVDDEGHGSGRWAKVRASIGPLLFQWQSGCLESNIIALLADDQLERFMADSYGESFERRRTLADRLDMRERDFQSILATAPDIKALMIAAATGESPPATRPDQTVARAWRNHGRTWFKTAAGGAELEKKVTDFGLWPRLEPQLLPFINAVRLAVELPELPNLR